MTGDIFRGYLLDGFFNLVGALTGQGILLVGMMTEAVVTPWLSDRDLALQNVRYVLDAAGGLTEDFRPPRRRLHPDPRPPGAVRGGRAARGHRRRRQPAARSDRRRHVRPDEAPGRPRARASTVSSGRATGYSTRRREILEARRHDQSDGESAAVRRHDRRRHGAGVVHPAGAARQAGRGRRGPAGQQDGHRPGAAWCTPRRWGRTSRSSSSTARCTTWSTSTRSRCIEREYPLLGAQGGQRDGSSARCGARSSWSVRASAPTRTPWASTRSSTSRASRGRRAWSTTPRSRSCNLGAQVLVPELVERARAAKADAVLVSPGRDAEGRPPAQHPRDGGRVPRGVPGRTSGRCSSSVGRASTSRAPRSSASTGSSARARPPARSRPTSSTSIAPEKERVAMTRRRPAARPDGDASPLRALRARALRRRPGRRRVRPRALR